MDESLKKPLSINAGYNEKMIKDAFGSSIDLVIKHIRPAKTNLFIIMIYLDGITDKISIRQVLESFNEHDYVIPPKANLVKFIGDAVPIGSIARFEQIDKAIDHLLNGRALLLVDGEKEGICLGTEGIEHRQVNIPTSQTVIKGPQEGFTETLSVNVALVRKRIKDVRLKNELFQVGYMTKTNMSIMYVEGIAKQELIDEVKTRLSKINFDSVLDSNYVEELIQDGQYSLFPTIFDSERPDTVAADLLEGRVAIFIDGSPFVLTCPTVLIQFFQSSEDYYTRSEWGFLRWLRIFSFLIAILAPGVFLAVTTFHQEMLPTNLLISLAAQRETIPFPAIIEALLMQMTFEILREAGVRMPRAIGSAVSIVGAIVLGEAAVTAGLVSAAMVIVISLTAIANFVSPEYAMTYPERILRLLFMIVASIFGLYGIIVVFIMLSIHLSSLESFGVPYTEPIGPFQPTEQKDTFFRLPFKYFNSRPKLLARQSKRTKPREGR